MVSAAGMVLGRSIAAFSLNLECVTSLKKSMILFPMLTMESFAFLLLCLITFVRFTCSVLSLLLELVFGNKSVVKW